ncbi:hypothetical protein GF354_00460 [Candidatus Peregrinibacteria bacterium]|nr:hypothetical protein [Candidatus Peregrinibacteria bacterium]
MYKKVIHALALLSIIGLFLGCTATAPIESSTESENQKIRVAATIFPLYDIASNVAGEFAQVELILAPGASPHTYEFTPSDLTKLQGVKKIFAIGEGVDSWSDGIGDNVEGVEIVELDQYIVLREYEEDDYYEQYEEHRDDEYHGEDNHDSGNDYGYNHDSGNDYGYNHEVGNDHGHNYEGDNDEHHHGEYDPHYWLAPNNAAIMAKKITDELSELDPANADQYSNNADSFIATLNKKDIEWKEAINSLSQRYIVTFHDSFSYFADHFDLNVLTSFEPFPGREPTPSYLQELEHEIEEFNISVLFTEPQLHPSSLEQFAKDHAIEVFVLDPLGGAIGRESYLELIDYNVQTIVDALQ